MTVSSMIEVTTPDGAAEAWLTLPAEPGPHPGVLLFIDAIGLRARICEMADRIASWGYVVLVPHVFYREGSATQTRPEGPLNTDEARSAFFAEAGPRIGRLTPSLSAPDTTAYLDYLTSRPEQSGPVGVVGYCMGARLAIRAAGAHPGLVAACAGFHGGGLATDAPDSPHLALSTASASFAFGHADDDPSMDPVAVARLGEALAEAGLSASNEVYAGARHGYTMSDTAVFDPVACERHFAELRALFDASLGQPS